ncbi:hypothetical protein ABK040_004755 [Willaertia magna]
MTTLPTVILDNGSGSIKAGIAGYEKPISDFPNIIGKPKDTSLIVGTVNRSSYVGESAISKRGVLLLDYPIENGIVTNWEAWEEVFEYTYFNELKLAPEEQPLLMTDAPLTPKNIREKLTEIIMEKYEIPAFYLGIQGVLALMASGRLTGVCLDVGDGNAHSIPMFDGQLIPNAVFRLGLGGRDITEYLMKMLSERGHNFVRSAEREIIRNVKEKLCYIAVDYQEECTKAEESSALEKEYVLPDGRNLVIANERFRSTEVLFTPQFIGMESSGIHEITFDSISHSPIDIRKTLYHNIVISGGCTLLDGLQERMQREITELAPSSMDIRVVAPENRRHLVWIGGSIMATLSSFFNLCLTRDEYNEYGPEAIHVKTSI